MREVQRHGLLGKSDACVGFESRSSLATAVEVLVGRADLAKTLGAMREWLDRNDRRLAHFETKANGDIITVKVPIRQRRFSSAVPPSYPRLYAAKHRPTAGQGGQGPRSQPQAQARPPRAGRPR